MQIAMFSPTKQTGSAPLYTTPKGELLAQVKKVDSMISTISSNTNSLQNQLEKALQGPGEELVRTVKFAKDHMPILRHHFNKLKEQVAYLGATILNQSGSLDTRTYYLPCDDEENYHGGHNSAHQAGSTTVNSSTMQPASTAASAPSNLDGVQPSYLRNGQKFRGVTTNFPPFDSRRLKDDKEESDMDEDDEKDKINSCDSCDSGDNKKPAAKKPKLSSSKTYNVFDDSSDSE